MGLSKIKFFAAIASACGPVTFVASNVGMNSSILPWNPTNVVCAAVITVPRSSLTKL